MDNISKIPTELPPLKNNKKGILTFFMSILGIIALVMGFLIYARANPNGTVFGMRMADVNANVNHIFTNIFSFNIFQNNGDKTVAATTPYTYLGSGKYATEDSSIRALNSGTINVVEDDNLVVISYDNGVVASYYALEETFVKTNDRLKANDLLASYSESFYVVFLRDNNQVTYEEAFH